MAIPVAVTGGPQTFAYTDLPAAVSLDGTDSYDPDGDPISSYSWTVVEIPSGSSAALDDATSATPSFGHERFEAHETRACTHPIAASARPGTAGMR